MASIIEQHNLADLVKYEEECLNYSRENITVASGQSLAIGTVLGRKTADGKVHALDPAATDGTETAIGLLIETVDATLIDRNSLLLARHGIVASKAVVWPVGITAPQKLAAIAQLESLGILVRQSA
jgi:hypothetical protein